jgi:hypothetical protein
LGETVLLAVDVGVRTGLAGFDSEGKLLWWASRNFGSVARLKRAIPSLLRECPALHTLVVEGDGRLALLWQKQARELEYRWISAETWREELLIQRQRRSGEQAKRTAVELARAQIRKDGLSPPRKLGHDAAEAILVGLWARVHLLDTPLQSRGNDSSTSG